MKKVNKIYYFAYGSNIYQKRLEHRVGKVNYIGNCILKGYNLTFKFNGFANIFPDPKESVEGCLYEITTEQLSNLDLFEGLYRREYFMIDNILVVTYVGLSIPQKYFFDSEKYYIQTIIEGCIEKNVNKTYELAKAYFDSIPLKISRKAKRKQFK